MNIKEIVTAVGGRLLCGDENLMIDTFSTNSKEGSEQSIFVPIIGERTDAHNFIQDAKNHGMQATFTSRGEIAEGAEDMTYIYVDDTVRALQDAAAYHRNQYKLPIIGITGSVGKTTTKEMVAAALEGGTTSGIILKTEGNMNSQIGLSQMMLKIEDVHKIAVIEMGMSMEGEMERLSEIARPSTAIITNIGVAHIGNLKSKENIRKAKMNILNDMPNQGVLLVNGDDPFLLEVCEYIKSCQGAGSLKTASIHACQDSVVDLTAATRGRLADITVYSYGLGEHCDYQARNIKVSEGKTEFVYSKNIGYDHIREKVILSVLGMHNVLNALAALAIADLYQVSLETAKEGLYRYQPIAMRGGIEKINGITLIDDTYNASPDSMKSGIDVLETLEGAGRKIAILADILELGDVSEEEHRGVGRYIAGKEIDILVTVGYESRYISEEVMKLNERIQVRHFEENQAVIHAINQTITNQDAYYLKGSRGMKLDEIAKELKRTKEVPINNLC